jgi:hypothetical protein
MPVSHNLVVRRKSLPNLEPEIEQTASRKGLQVQILPPAFIFPR